MALFNATYAADEEGQIFAIAVQAGNAAEMVTRLMNAVAAAIAEGRDEISDFKLAGAASGLDWEAWMISGEAADVSVEFAEINFTAAEAGNPAEASLRLNQQLAALFAARPLGFDLHVWKVEVAGAGNGPTYMAVALYSYQETIG